MPNTISNYDSSVLLATIIRNYSSLPVLYEDPDWYYDECEFWWKAHEAEFIRMWEAMEAEYDPTHNYDKHEEYHGNDTESSNKQGSDNGSVSVDADNKVTGTESRIVNDHYNHTEDNGGTNTRDLATNNFVAGYDGGIYELSPSSKITETGSEHHSDSNTTEHTGNSNDVLTHNTRNENDSNTTSTSQFSESGSNSSENNYTSHTYGNIGVTTTQQMITAEIKLRCYNLYDIMANKFANSLCLGIW